MSTLSVVVVNWDASAALRDCLSSLREQSRRPDELIVVDNGSSDDSIEMVVRDFAEARILSLPSNQGYCRGANAGLAVCRGDLILFLNNDTACAPDFVESLVAATERYPHISLFTPRVVKQRNPELIDNRGLGLTPWLAAFQIAASRPNESVGDRAVFGASGAALLARRSLLDEIGGLDEDLIAIHDDTDISMRAQLAGFGCMYIDAAIVYHHGSLSLARVPEQTLRLMLRNQELVLVKNLPAELIVLLPLHLAYVLFELARWARRGRFGTAVRAKVEALQLAPRFFRKRRLQGTHRRLAPRAVFGLLNTRRH